MDRIFSNAGARLFDGAGGRFGRVVLGQVDANSVFQMS